MTSRICATVTGRTMAELRRRRDEVRGADLVEVRLDTVATPDVAGALAGRDTPVIVTCRPRWEGGHFDGSEEERHRLLAEAQQLGAEYVDVEWQAGFTDLLEARGGRGIVLSMHDFNGVPADLDKRVAAMRTTGAEVVKVAVMAKRLSDTLALLALERADRSTVLIAMGEAGIASRVLAPRFGSCWTYAGDGVAPGQITVERLIEEFGIRRLTAAASVYGVVGRPVRHSLSPAMHNAAFRATGRDAVYLPLAAADIDDFLTFADALSIAGASVTAPFKRAAFERAADCDETGRRVEAVNTLRRGSHGWEACNTDVPGFLAPLAACMDVRGRRATVLGAGGAARAVAYALRHAGAHVAIAARNPARAAEAARSADAVVASWPPAPGSWDLLVNATPIGTTPDVDASPLPNGALTGELVYDLVYNPPDTKLLVDARRAGCETIGGLDMLVAQAERQFEWWTGERPPADTMRAAALGALASAAAGSTADGARREGAPGPLRTSGTLT